MEQIVGDFFPYSQQKLGFDKPVTIIFQSDEDNSSRMLGKTAYYNPASFEVVLYTDGRHPKDVMRSLSHELVHHAQNCRGDFTSTQETPEGYAQKDPHLRKMEREAYTKGNLIFRDYEDLIKTGKKDVDIDFSRSGEPKMSLKEWKNGELNTRLMKKWGLLTEDSGEAEREHEKRNVHADEKHAAALEKDVKYDKEHEDLEEGFMDKLKAGGAAVKSVGGAIARGGLSPEESERNKLKWAMRKARDSKDPDAHKKALADYTEFGRTSAARQQEEDLEEGWGYRDEDDDNPVGRTTHRHANPLKALSPEDYEGIGSEEREDEEGNRPSMAKDLDLDEGDPLMKLTPKGHRDTETSSDRRLAYEKDPAGHMTTAQALELGLSPDTVRSAVDWHPDAEHPDDRRDMRQYSRGGHAVGLGTARRRWRNAFAGQFKEGKISIREAKKITRRIIERIKKEGR